MSDERAAFEADELRGLARQYGAKRVQVEPGVFAWQFPRWICEFCGPGVPPQPGCFQPLALHLTDEEMVEWRRTHPDA
jgi:hypothetical protein